MSVNRIKEPDNYYLNDLDALDLEETDALLAGIDKVTLLPYEEKLLREKVLKNVLKEDLKLSQQKEKNGEAERRGIAKNSRPMRRIAACLAAVLVCTMAVVAASNMEALQRFWGSDTEIYSDNSSETAQSVQDANMKVNIEGIVSDKYQCVFILSAEALTGEGQIILKDADKDIASALKINRTVLRGDSEQGATRIFQYTDENKNKDYKAYQCDFTLENVDLTKPVTVEFAGLSMDFSIPEQMQAITLYPDSEAAIASVELSPIGYYYRASEFADEVRLINGDGTLDEELGYHASLFQEDKEVVMVIGSFTRLINLNAYQGIQIDGIKYFE